MSFTDSLRGYAYPVHKRDGFICRYCGLDGSVSYENWICLSLDHLLPKCHPDRENRDFAVTACKFCNTADNRYFENAAKRGLKFDGMTPEQLVKQRKRFVMKVRESYRSFWCDYVTGHSEQAEEKVYASR